MDETQFHRVADAALNHMFDALEAHDEKGSVEVEFQSGVMSITLPGDQNIIISKHTPMRQLWLSSPVAGGLHFMFGSGKWQLIDGRTLYDTVAKELKQLAKIEVDF